MNKPMIKPSQAVQELERAKEKIDTFDASIKEMTLDRMNMAPKEEREPQTKLSQREIANSTDIYLKPSRSISSQEKFNESFRESYNYDKEYVFFIAENNELIGENLEMWTKPYPGMPAEFWEVPANKPIWGPRYLAEQIKRKSYHRLIMKDTVTGNAEIGGQWFGQMAADTTIQRLDARPATKKKSIFLSSSGF